MSQAPALWLVFASSLPSVALAAPYDAFLEDGTRLPLPQVAPPTGSVVAHVEPRLGVPTFVWGDRGSRLPSAKSRGLTAEAAAIEVFTAHAELYRLSPADVPRAKVVSVVERPEGPVIVTFGVEIGGVAILRNQLKVLMNRDYRMIAISGYLSPRSFFRPMGARVSRSSALKRAAADLGTTSAGARVRSTYFVLGDRIEPAFDVELADEVRIVSGVDGRILYRASLAFAHGYRVYAEADNDGAPMDDPSGGALSPHPTGRFEALGEWSIGQAYVEKSGWLAPGAADLVGPRVAAYVDQAMPNGYAPGDIMPVFNSATGFDYPHDPSLDPRASSTQAAAAATQLFYTTNHLRDVWAAAGFDSPDLLLAEVESTVNPSMARMIVPRVGASPRMETFLVEHAPEVEALGWGDALYARRYFAGPSGIGPSTYAIDAELMLSEDEGRRGCEAPIDPLAYQGKIVLMREGVCEAAAKAQIAADAGAGAVVIVAAQPAWRASNFGPGDAAIPVASMLATDGEDLVTALEAGNMVGLELFGRAASRRDAAFDASVVAHEMGHLLSARSIAEGRGLSNVQGLALAEGWSDFMALLSMVEAEDVSASDFGGLYAVGGYAAKDRYFGARRLPYSSDFGASPMTYGHLDPNAAELGGVPHLGPSLRPHDAGEVWASMLWEGAVALLRDRPRLDFATARARMRVMMVASLGITPAQPTFLEARDAFLAVAMAIDPADYSRILGAFARRGAGQGAVSPERAARDFGGVVESFRPDEGVGLLVARFEQSGICDADAILDDGEAGALVLTIENRGIATLDQATVLASTTVPGAALPGVPVVIPAIPPRGIGEVSIPISLSGRSPTVAEVALVISDPTLLGPSSLVTFLALNQDVRPSLRDDFEVERTLWASSSMPGVEGWSRVRDESGHRAWFMQTPRDASEVSLVSPPLAVKKGTPFRFSFRHRYAFAPGGDGGVVEISLDRGLSWFDVGAASMPGYPGLLEDGKGTGAPAFVGISPSLPARDTVVVDLGESYGGRTLMIRFRAISDDNVAWWGWDIDEVEVSGAVGLPFQELVPEDHLCPSGVPTTGPRIGSRTSSSILAPVQGRLH